MNSFFKKRKSRKCTWLAPNGRDKNEIDFILAKEKDVFTDIDVINKLNFNTDHRMVRGAITNTNNNLRKHNIIHSPNNKTTTTSIPKNILSDLRNKLQETDEIKSTQEKYNFLEKELINLIKSSSKKEKTNKFGEETLKLMETRNGMLGNRRDNKQKIASISIKIHESIRKHKKEERLRVLREQIEKTGGINKGLKQLKEYTQWIPNIKTKSKKNKNEKLTAKRLSIVKVATEFYKKLYTETDSTLPAEEEKEIHEEEIPCILESEVIKAIQSQKSDIRTRACCVCVCKHVFNALLICVIPNNYGETENEPFIPQNLTGLSMALTRGKTAHMDVVRVETKSKIMFSFLSVGWGLLSDIDIESERLRVIGGQRFTVWTLARLVGLRKYKGVVSYAKIKDVSNLPKPKHPLTISHSVSQDGALDSPDADAFFDCDENSEVFTSTVNGKRHQRVDSWYSVNSRRSAFYSTRGSEYHSVTSSGSEMRSPVHACMHGPASHLPSLVSKLPSHWVTEEGEFVMVYVSYQAFIGEELLFAPRSQLSDGIMWMLLIKAGISRSQILSLLLSMNQGNHSEVNTEYVKMIPVSAFRIVPEGSSGILTVDGELVEYGPIQAEIFPNIVNLIVPDTK
ncbi:unnamed protein product [Euphydryas editha]|uniref:YegS/DAGK C-terminal domain-containing protein n=1 Tax=Euphydryas editha TaxID=104508 RepID=A0AAU9TVR3_EUPED|nr:unnamed protein product [Euphydryas editha]